MTDSESPMKEILNIADWHLHRFDMMDELFGQFPIDFEIEGEDANPDNVAEALAEIYGLSIDLKAEVYENKMAVARCLLEVGLARLVVNRIFKNIEAAIEYIDFEREEAEEDVELTFNPLAYEDKDNDGDIDDDSLEKFLQPSKQPIKYWKSPDGSADSLRKAISLLQEAAQITKSLHWHRMPRDPGAAKDILRNLINLGVDVAKDFAQYKGESDDSWQDFIENIEENWKDKTGAISDDSSDNPRIKEIK
ncbi:MAG: hypothetical protein F6K54_01585 [Okeania sp. SIO3B5]|uniref:hypothetical protein n=1 Tax=Okeania sp. SIO3B5 TaxID=2607811 RepID=UPI0014000B4D|nr:hypothetical protein [Okeania sp. SIO3B5]NEO51894.1 hypothetical protein [Okeania sp. SIO3B5]